jgi:hypothetical protein
MPPSPIKGLIRGTLNLLIGFTERALELIGDPDFRESVKRDRRALRLSNDRLVEALREIDDLEDRIRHLENILEERHEA